MGGFSRAARIALLAVVVGGCGKPGDVRTPAERFRQEQSNTVTPHGRIDPGSVRDRDGKIDYETSDGSKWTVEPPVRNADGTSHYRPPERRN